MWALTEAGVTVGFEGDTHIYPKTLRWRPIEVGWRLMIVMMGKLFETEQLTEARVEALLDEAKSGGEPYALTFASQERQEELRTNRLEREKRTSAIRRKEGTSQFNRQPLVGLWRHRCANTRCDARTCILILRNGDEKRSA